MAYSDFTLQRLKKDFGIKNKVEKLFEKLNTIEPSEWLKNTLERTLKIQARTEKAKSETIVFPILLEVKEINNDFISIFSGDTLIADDDKGLKGECDFIITKNTHSYNVNYPILQVVEAKNHDIDLGVPQCAAQMVGAKIYNEQNDIEVETIYGCVTTGDDWLFLKLKGNILYIDNMKYYLGELEELLAVFQQIVDYYKEILTVE